MVNEYKILTLKKKSFFVDVEVQTFFDSRDWSNHFHDMLSIWKMFYKVSRKFYTYPREYMRYILNYTAGKWTFFEIFDIETIREPRIFYHIASCSTWCQNEWPGFSNWHLTISNFEKWYSGEILRTSCFYFFDLGLLFLKIAFFEATWKFFKHMWSMSTSS